MEKGASSVTTTAWRFSGTEGADAAVLRLKQLDSQELMDVQDVAVLRWPQYASAPQLQEHVTDEGNKASSLAKRIRKAGIDGAMIQSVKDDMKLGTSALVVLSADAAIESVAKAFEGQAMELIRSDLSVQQEDALQGRVQRRPRALTQSSRLPLAAGRAEHPDARRGILGRVRERRVGERPHVGEAGRQHLEAREQLADRPRR